MSPILRNPSAATFVGLKRLSLLGLIALLTFPLPPSNAEATSGSPAGFYVEATGHVLGDSFLQYWVDFDGLRSLGMPVSDIVERNGRTTQYFQYGVLVLKSNETVTRLKAGDDLLSELRAEPRMIEGRRFPSSRTTQGVRETKTVNQTSFSASPPPARVDSEMLPYWQQWGGEATLGHPISPLYRQGRLRMQWFEFGRIDLNADGAQLAKVGLELAQLAEVQTGPAEQGNVPLFDPARFVSFAGDGTVPNAAIAFDPVRLQIPSIQVDAGIEVTSVQSGVMTNPVDPWKAGWYQSFSRPGDWTNVVIAGHRDWWGYGPVVFWNLGYLQLGATIYLLDAVGSGATYVVGSVTVVPSTVDPQTIINDVGYEALTLITCGGSWTGTEYTSRIIVRAYRI